MKLFHCSTYSIPPIYRAENQEKRDVGKVTVETLLSRILDSHLDKKKPVYTREE